MRYINKEYGFTFRPPFYSKFYEESAVGPPVGADNFPLCSRQGAGYDYSAVNGCMLAGKNGSMWGIKVLCLKGGRWLDGTDYIAGRLPVGANTADGSYAHINLGDVSVKWAKLTEQGVVLKISSNKKRRIRVVSYPCFKTDGELSIEGSVVKGRSPFTAVLPGTVELTGGAAVMRGRYMVIDGDNREFFLLHSYNKPSACANGAFNEAIMEFVLNSRQHDIYIYASVGDRSLYDKAIPSLERSAHQLQTAELRYGVNKPMGGGTLGGVAEPMCNSTLWSRMYYPYLMTEIFTPCRRELDDNFNLKGTEECCGAILGAAVSPETALRQAVFTAGDPVMGLFALWNVYCRCPDKKVLAAAYDKLYKKYPADGALVVSGPDKRDVAYGWEDSPVKERKNALSMYSLDLSCLKLLGLDIMASIARETDHGDGQYAASARELKKRIDDFFYDPQRRAYFNRYVTGDFASASGATSFYPLTAGVAEEEKLTGLLTLLTDNTRFWGEYVVPTLDKSHKEYGKRGKPDNNGKRQPPYLSYRGSIVPYVNYLIYIGLVRCGADRIGAEMAKKCAALWLDQDKASILNYAKYLPSGKAQSAAPSSAGNLLALIAVEELIGVEYFADRPGKIRFGTLAEGNNNLTNYKLLGKLYSLSVSDDSTVLMVGGRTAFRADGGKCKVRGFVSGPDGGEFVIIADSDLTVSFNGFDERTRKTAQYFFLAKKGKTRVVAQNGIIELKFPCSDIL